MHSASVKEVEGNSAAPTPMQMSSPAADQPFTTERPQLQKRVNRTTADLCTPDGMALKIDRKIK
jgi:hypothetical protein